MTPRRLLLLVALGSLALAAVAWWAIGDAAALVMARAVGSLLVAAVIGFVSLASFGEVAADPCDHGHVGYCGTCEAAKAPKCEAHGRPWFCGECGPQALTCGMLAGNPRPRKKRPGQWGWRARMLRARRRDRAERVRDRAQAYRWEEGDRENRATRRMVLRRDIEWRAEANYGVRALPGESTTALRDRVERAALAARDAAARAFAADLGAT